MSILWVGGEDIDFPNAGGVVGVNTTSGGFRSGYSRCSIFSATATVSGIKSTVFPGGSVTSAWLGAQLWSQNNTFQQSYDIGFSTSSLVGTPGIYIGTPSPAKLSIVKFDGTTFTTLASETGNSLANGSLTKIDMQVISYGASGTVNVYANGALVVTFTGNIAVSGMTNFDSVVIGRTQTAGTWCAASEIIVATTDTRSLALATLAPTGSGSTDAWTGAITTINGISLSDASPNYTNTVSLNQEAAVNSLPSGNWAIQLVKIAARAAVSASPTASHVALGYQKSGTVAVGSAQSPGLSYATLEEYDTVNPLTSAAWVQSDLTSIQLAMQSS